MVIGASLLIGAVLFIVAIMIFLHFVPLGLWISAMAAGVNVGIFSLVGLRPRRLRPPPLEQ